MNRRGFTLTELLVGMSVVAILGVSLTRILINDSRFVSRQDAMLGSRQGARAALNTLVSEISMVADTVVLAKRDSLTVRVPVAFGITCRRVIPDGPDSARIVSILPVDSVAWAGLDTLGMLWRDDSLGGIYRRVNLTMVPTTAPADLDRCLKDSVRTLPGGKVVRISLTALPKNTVRDSLAVAILYSRVTYAFAPSVDLPGRIGLWRKPQNGVAEELVTPFDTSARFAYLMGGPNTTTMVVQTNSVTTKPGLDSIRGIELRLFAASESKAQGTSAYQVFPLKTRVRFANK